LLCHPSHQCNDLVQGSYSAYADPIARRAVAVSFSLQSNGDTAPNHPVHPSRLQNTIRRRIRDPNQHDALLVQHTPNFHSFEHQSEFQYPMRGRGRHSLPLSAMSPAFHGTSVTPSFTGTVTPHPSEPYFEQTKYSFEPDAARFSHLHDAVEQHHGNLVLPFFQNSNPASNYIFDARPSGLARFQHQPVSGRLNGTPRNRAFFSPSYQSNRSADDFISPSQLQNSISSFAPYFGHFGDETYFDKRDGSNSYPNTTSRRLASLDNFHNSEEGLTSSVPTELLVDSVHSDIGTGFSKGSPFPRRNDGQVSSSGILRFQNKRLSSKLKLFENDLELINCTAEDSMQRGSNGEIRKPDDVRPAELPVFQFHGTMTNAIGKNVQREPLNNIEQEMPLSNTEQEMNLSYPCVRTRQPVVLQRKIRFFNEGLEVDSENRPLSRRSSLDSMASSIDSLGSSRCLPWESDDELDLAGKTSMMAVCLESRK
jgi:hypothetical protein